jgi:DNA-binding MarR family transcriptional regulator
MQEQYRRINQLLMCIDRRRKQIGENAMAELDIQPSQHFALVWLKHTGKMNSQALLAEKMQVSPASVARTLKSLDKDGYIARCGGTDGRCNEIAITEKGEGVLEKSMHLFQGLDARCYAGFSPEEMQMMNGLLEKLLTNLNQIKNEGEMHS